MKTGKIATANVVPDPEQPRKRFDEDDLLALGENLKKVGQIQPILVYQDGSGFVLLDGERRWRAAKLVGMSEITAIVLTERPTKARLRVLQASLDVHREQYTPMEQSNLLAEIVRETGWGVSELAEQVSMKQPKCTKLLAYQGLAPQLQAALHEGVLNTEKAYLISQVTDFSSQVEMLKSSSHLSREQLRAKVNDNGQAKPMAKRSVFHLPSGMTIAVNGVEADLETVAAGLHQLLKELKKAISKSWDIHHAIKDFNQKASAK